MRLKPVIALLLLAAACERSPTSPSETFLVTAFATPQTVKAGATTNVVIAVTNESNATQTFNENFCGPAYRVSAPDGSALTGANIFCSAVFTGRTLAPGEQAVYAAQWTTVAVDSTGHTHGPLAAGTYTIRGATISGIGATNVSNVPFALTIIP